MPYAQRILDTLKDAGVPRIYFALNNAHLLEEIKDCGAEVVGMDWRMDLGEANRRLDGRYALQGNLDPTVLLSGSPETIRERARQVVAAGQRLPGHIFNLGHGILPETRVEDAQTLVQAVQEATS
jgi:uroporphyrinogen decarboxylase